VQIFRLNAEGCLAAKFDPALNFRAEETTDRIKQFVSGHILLLIVILFRFFIEEE
jgi:hypothetical protein